jgi:hypothetical protein
MTATLPPSGLPARNAGIGPFSGWRVTRPEPGRTSDRLIALHCGTDRYLSNLGLARRWTMELRRTGVRLNSRTVKHPNVILIAPASTDVFSRSNSLSAVFEFVPNRNCPLTVRSLRACAKHKCAAIPLETGGSGASWLAAADLPPVRCSLDDRVEWLTILDQRKMNKQVGLSMLDH